MSSSAKLIDQEVAVGRCGDHYNCRNARRCCRRSIGLLRRASLLRDHKVWVSPFVSLGTRVNGACKQSASCLHLQLTCMCELTSKDYRRQHGELPLRRAAPSKVAPALAVSRALRAEVSRTEHPPKSQRCTRCRPSWASPQWRK